MIPAPFEYFAPGTLEEALELLSSARRDAKLLAGGQSLVPLMKLRLSRPGSIVDLSRLSELKYIRKEGKEIAIGAMVTHAELERSELLKRGCPLLPRTAATIADVQVRNQGTIGGSLAHADPAGDLPAAILALDASIKATSLRGERWISAQDFFIGLLTTALEPHEVLTEVRVPILEQARTAYLKAAQRTSGFAVVGIAVCMKLTGDGSCEEIAIGVTGVGDKAYRARGVEDKLRGKKLSLKLIEEAAEEVTRDVEVIEDFSGSKRYRSHLARVYTVRAIQKALGPGTS